MCTTSKCCSASQVVGVVTGICVVAGVAALAWAMLSRRKNMILDPLSEADRRIDALEASLHRLQDTFSHAVEV